MDTLEKYKKAWDNQPEDVNKISKKEIYKLSHSKSSSIVKWILIIGILEFIVFNSLYMFVDMKEAYIEYERLGLKEFVFWTSILAYGILFYFLYLFYVNYKAISISDSTKVLMTKILKTRKTVRNYVLFNLTYLGLTMFAFTVASIQVDFNDLTNKQLVLTIIFMLVATSITLGLFYLFYQLLYGILLKKLNKNYKELSKIDD